MHEMSLCEGVVRLIEEASRREGFTRVKTVWLEIGQLASVEPEALRFGFDVVTRGGVAEGARLEIIATAGSAWCMRCSGAIEIEGPLDPCPRCGSGQIQVTGGTEMKVKELEVE